MFSRKRETFLPLMTAIAVEVNKKMGTHEAMLKHFQTSHSFQDRLGRLTIFNRLEIHEKTKILFINAIRDR